MKNVVRVEDRVIFKVNPVWSQLTQYSVLRTWVWCLISAILLLASLGGMSTTVHAQDLDWASPAGDAYAAIPKIAVDQEGNSYMAGAFKETATFGSGTDAITVSSRVGSTNSSLAKYDQTGRPLWVKQVASSAHAPIYDVAVDRLGNSYVAGEFTDDATFGEGDSTITLGDPPGFHAYLSLAKYDAEGVLLWAKKAALFSSTVRRVGGIALDHENNIYVTGFFKGTIILGEGQNAVSLTNTMHREMFIAKYNNHGELLWGKLAFHTDSNSAAGDIPPDIAVDGMGNSYATGSFYGTVTFGEGANVVRLTSPSRKDFFVAKYDTEGSLVWAKQGGGTGENAGTAIAVDEMGNSCATGAITNIAVFGETGNSVALSSMGGKDIFVACYDPGGIFKWARRAGGSDYESGLGIAIDNTGNVYMTGYIREMASFSGGETPIFLTSTGNNDIVVARYDHSGTLHWVEQAGNTQIDTGYDIDVNNRGGIYITGNFQSSVVFGNGDNATTMAAPGAFGRFVTKYIDTDTAPPEEANTTLYVSAVSAGSVGNLTFNDEDILAYDIDTGEWTKYFDGSDLNIRHHDINAFTLLTDGSLLMSFNAEGNIPGFGTVDDSDIVKFIPTSLGEQTSGNFEWVLDGSDVGLTGNNEDIDAISLTPEGQLAVSVRGSFDVSGVTGGDEDLIILNNAIFGKQSAGAWALYFDGSNVNLDSTNEDINATWIDPLAHTIYLGTKRAFEVENAMGDASDIFTCVPVELGNATSCAFDIFWEGETHGFGDSMIDGLAISRNPSIVASLVTDQDTINVDGEVDMPETEDIHDWDDEEGIAEQNYHLFLPIINR